MAERTSMPADVLPATESVPITIPFNKPFLTGNEFGFISEAISLGQAAGNGPFTRRCHELLERLLHVPRAFLTTSCTDALEMAAILLDVRDGDEIIVPSFTFVSTANAFALRGARIVFADIRPDTLNMDEQHLARLVTPRTKAIVPVHYAGVGCEMDEILSIARDHAIVVVEDNAHGLFGRYKGKMLGSFGALATQSFHETKNVTCGEGGALIVNDENLIERAEIIRDKGTNRNRFYRGEVDKYTWVDLGSSFLPSDILAAYLYAQLQARRRIQSARRRIWELYWDSLGEWAAGNDVRMPVIPRHCEQPYHMFYLILPSLQMRQALIAHLRSRGILAVFHYQPLHLSEMGRHFGGQAGDCPVTEDMSDRLLRLPFYNALTEDEQIAVVGAIRDFRY
jgi:dTDP-4-amino-4,6-dideoxygalactose transaminase